VHCVLGEQPWLRHTPTDAELTELRAQERAEPQAEAANNPPAQQKVIRAGRQEQRLKAKIKLLVNMGTPADATRLARLCGAAASTSTESGCEAGESCSSDSGSGSDSGWDSDAPPTRVRSRRQPRGKKSPPGSKGSTPIKSPAAKRRRGGQQHP
jgi:hypothetical protein